MSRDDPAGLTDEQKRLADEIAAEALDLPEGDRADFVRSRCGSDRAIREEVMSLLEYIPDADGHGPFAAPPALPPLDDDEADRGFRRPDIPGFRIRGELGHGGMGMVYEAFQDSLGRVVALKVLPANLALSPKAVERFRREARAAASLHNPHIVPVYDFGEHDGLYYYTMERIEGESLARGIRDRRRILSASHRESGRRDASATADPAYVVAVAEQFAAVAEALHVAHEAGLLHRDLKPSNIMVGADGQYRLIDFGLVRERDAGTLTLTGELMGTLAYMAPEQVARQPVDRRTDIYSLGATLYEALTFDPPFRGSSDHELQSRILTEEPVSPTRKNLRLSRDLETIVLKTLEKNPRRRYATAHELAEDLQRFLRYEPIEARPAGAVTRTLRWTRRNPVKSALGCAAALFVLGGAGFLIGQRIVRADAVLEHIARAEHLLEEDDLAGAMEAIGRAQGLDPSSFAALTTRTRIEERSVELEKREARSKAEEARRESAIRAADYAKTTKEIAGLKKIIEEKRRTTLSEFVPGVERVELARLERTLELISIESERLLEEAREALERAVRLEAPWGGPGPATEAAYASFFFDRWKEALAARDAVREQVLRSSIEAWDRSGTYGKALLGRGSLTVRVSPSGRGDPSLQIRILRCRPRRSSGHSETGSGPHPRHRPDPGGPLGGRIPSGGPVPGDPRGEGGVPRVEGGPPPGRSGDPTERRALRRGRVRERRRAREHGGRPGDHAPRAYRFHRRGGDGMPLRLVPCGSGEAMGRPPRPSTGRRGCRFRGAMRPRPRYRRCGMEGNPGNHTRRSAGSRSRAGPPFP